MRIFFLTDEEKKDYTIAVVAQAKSNYQLRNKIINADQGNPAGMFAKIPNQNDSKDGNLKKETRGYQNKMNR